MQIKTKYQKLIDKIEALETAQREKGHAKPKKACIENAKALAYRLYKIGRFDLDIPTVSPDEQGNLVLEWWSGQEKITIFVFPKKIRVWDVNNNGDVIQEKYIPIKEFES